MAGTEGNAEMNVLKGLVNSLAQSVQTLTARQSAPTDQLKKSVELNSELEYQQRCIKRERDCDSKKQGIVRQQNLLDELKTRIKSITTSVETAPTVILDDPTADLSKPVTVKRGSLADTDEGKEILLALGSADKLLASRLLDLSVVCAASTNAVGWSVVEALTGASWRDYCTDEKHALVVKDALAAQEKRASDTHDRDRKDRDRKDRGRGRGGGGFNSSEGYRSRRTHRAGSEDDVGSWNTYNGQYIPPPSGAPPRSAAPGSAAGGMAANRSSGSFHSQNDFCYKCTQTGHRSSNCPNPPAPGRF
jgi:hypothetical protein